MSTPNAVIEPVVEKEFDQKSYMDQANKAAAMIREGKSVPEIPIPAVVEKKVAKVEEEPKDGNHDLNRRARRMISAKDREIGELRGRLQAMEEFGVVKTKPVEAEQPKVEDPEPQRAQFNSDAEYNRAVGRWDARQEAKTALSKKDEDDQAKQQLADLRLHIANMDAKCAEDVEDIDDWEEVAKASTEDKDTPRYDDKDPKNWFMLRKFAESEVRAYLLHHLAKNPDDMRKILELADPKDFTKQDRYIERLEGKVEVMYSKKKEKEVGQASEEQLKKQAEPPKERPTHPAEAQAGRTASERDALKPKPTSEVSAKGGSAPLEDPAPGTAAWMAMRNRQQAGR